MQINEISDQMLAQLAERKVDGDAHTRKAGIDMAMTSVWKEDMSRRLQSLDMEAASARSKLPKLYALVDQAGIKRAPFVACKQGCDACCHMQVEIADVEAQRIATFTKRNAAKLPPGRHTTPMEALGRQDTPCPFLVNHACSIYEVRPFVCRDLAVLDRDALACSMENMALARANDPRTLPVAQSSVQPVVEAFARLVVRPSATFADIRQFFPTTE